MIKNKADEVPTQNYFFPDYGLSVEATSLEEAQKLAEKQHKKEVGDGE